MAEAGGGGHWSPHADGLTRIDNLHCLSLQSRQVVMDEGGVDLAALDVICGAARLRFELRASSARPNKRVLNLCLHEFDAMNLMHAATR